MNKSLWPKNIADKDAASLWTPRDTLQEQADALTKLTKSKLVGNISIGSVDKTLYFDFKIVVPNINRYTYVLFVVNSNLDLTKDNRYSINFIEEKMEGSSDTELESHLSYIFNSNSTRKIISSLLNFAENKNA